MLLGCGRINIEPLGGDGGTSGDRDIGGDVAGDGARSDWWDADYAKRMKLVFDNDGGPTHLGLPLLIHLDPSRIDFADLQSDGDDIRFVDADNVTKLPYELDIWNSTASKVWVRVPAIDAISTTDFIWMYYGHPSASSGENHNAVWADYALVYHMRDTPTGTAGDIADSSPSNNDGTSQNGMTSTALGPGVIGGSLLFDGTDDFITAPNTASLRIPGTVTLQMWLNVTTQRSQWLMDFVTPTSEQEANNHLYEVSIDAGNRLEMQWEYGAGNDENYNSPNALATAAGTWHLITIVRDAATTRLMFYENGLPLGGNMAYANDATGGTTSTFYLGGEIDGTSSKSTFSGRIDEVRIWPGLRESGFVLADYRSMVDSLVTYGAPESY